MVKAPVLETLPEPPAGLPNDAPSDVALSVLSGAAVEVIGFYHVVADRLTRLQGWVLDQKALSDDAPH